ncbi:type II toxin-antitoxin system VapC family toxin [Nitrosomonas sp.]|uniref:type II toxin-antitoxin system VapC family toxin n=1 Tax=Nitrosomonas sp. TaxID=42353 RepID=UPI001DBA0DDF|nr:type II toxin-antitoxin system VapC family toxin [Nitrosomonas sp.]MBX3617057.1 type II toxin-antitoxin system VapC family toxin [Nitrosomonas sp.]
MIVLDTNVISELMREQPDANVKRWIKAQKPIHLAITAITIAEIQRGLARLPEGKRRTQLTVNFLNFIAEAFSGRIFPFDEEAVYRYGEIAAACESSGINTDAVNLMIAAIASSKQAAIATRNVKDFTGCNVAIINPWMDLPT